MIDAQDDTVFHKILRKEIPADIAYEDDDVLVFHDIRPKAPLHVLFVPKTFVQSVAEAKGATEHIPGMLLLKARDFAARKGIPGYKLVYHVGKEGGQEVPYLHLHFLSDTTLSR